MLRKSAAVLLISIITMAQAAAAPIKSDFGLQVDSVLDVGGHLDPAVIVGAVFQGSFTYDDAAVVTPQGTNASTFPLNDLTISPLLPALDPSGQIVRLIGGGTSDRFQVESFVAPAPGIDLGTFAITIDGPFGFDGTNIGPGAFQPPPLPDPGLTTSLTWAYFAQDENGQLQYLITGTITDYTEGEAGIVPAPGALILVGLSLGGLGIRRLRLPQVI